MEHAHMNQRTSDPNCPLCHGTGQRMGGCHGWTPEPCWCVTLSRAEEQPPSNPVSSNHKLDTDRQVFFYEQDFYVLSNFSAFTLLWQGIRFDTSEAAYHWEKFPHAPEVREQIRFARSAHEAFKVAERHKQYRRADWDAVKFEVMRGILRAKADQHEYVRRKLLATGDRELVEDSWRDDVWGWGPNRDGQNALGKLWMEVRAELRTADETALVCRERQPCDGLVEVAESDVHVVLQCPRCGGCVNVQKARVNAVVAAPVAADCPSCEMGIIVEADGWHPDPYGGPRHKCTAFVASDG